MAKSRLDQLEEVADAKDEAEARGYYEGVMAAHDSIAGELNILDGLKKLRGLILEASTKDRQVKQRLERKRAGRAHS